MTNYEKLKETLKQLIKLSETKEVKLSEIELMDGSKLFSPAESIEVGVEIYKLDENGNQLVADNGEYELADGKILVVMDGKLAEIKEPAPQESVETPIEASETKVELSSDFEKRLIDLESKFSKILEILDGSIKESEVMMSKIIELEKSPSEDSTELTKQKFSANVGSEMDFIKKRLKKLNEKI